MNSSNLNPKFKSQEAYEQYLQKRREYYRENRERIRAADNASARRNRSKDPERYRNYQIEFKRRHAEDKVPPQVPSLKSNPERDRILKEIQREEIQ